MLVINPVHRATVSELTIHPWLNKGYDTPVDNYLPDRTPLTLPVDMEVVRGMTGFEFGTEIEIKEKLELIITSEEYQKAAKTLFDRTVESHRQLAELSLSSKYISNNTQRRPPNDDPQSIPAAYHPLISIYYLVKERLERERRSLSIESTKEAQFTGTYTTQDLQKQSVDVTSEKKESKSTVRRLSYAFPDKNNHDTKANEISSSASTPLQIPASQHKKNKSVSKAFEPASKFANDALFTPPQQTEPTDLEIATAAAAAAAALSSNQSKFGNRLSKILPRRMTLGQNSMNAENHTQFLNIVHANHQLKLQNDLKQRKKPIEDEEDEQSDLGLTTTRSFSKASPPKQQPFPAGTLDHQKGMADENVKPVFLKGLFSVTTTTTKCPSIIRADLIRVLERIGVKWRESQGRFECVHLPSINLHVVTQEESPDEVAKIPVPDLVVRFEIYIVKVPWLLGMHGLQFRRVGGDPWQYKNMCSKILTELKL